MYRLFVKFITYLVITTLLSQNITWAVGYQQLAPDSKSNLEKIEDLFTKNPASEDSRWMRFNGRKSSTSIPFRIKPEILQRFQKQLQDLGVIEGDIRVDEKVYFADTRDVVIKIQDKINQLGEVLRIFGPGTRVKVITDTTKPIFYNKNDNILEIHGFLFLEGTPEGLLRFCTHHEARHKQILDISPLMEEVLNIYMDFEYMDELESGNPNEAIEIINRLEELGEDGYAKILRMRYNRNKGIKEKVELLKEVLNYISKNYPEITEGGTINHLQETLDSEKDAPYSFVRLLIIASPFLYQNFPQELSRHLPSFIPQLAYWLYRNLDIFDRVKEDLIFWQEVKNKGYREVLENFIEFQKRKKLLDELLKEVRAIDNELKGFIEGIWFDLKVPIKRLNTAIMMAKLGSSQCAIAVSLLRGMGLKRVKELVRGSNITGAQAGHIIRLKEGYRELCNALNYRLYPARHMLQNALNLIIQLCRGDPDVLLLVIMDKIEYMEELSTKEGYERLSDEEKYLLMQSIEWLLIPLAEFLGYEELADKMRELYLKTVLGEELYEVARQEVPDRIGLRGHAYKDLSVVLKSIIDEVRNVLGDLPVRIDGRVKSPYSFHNKLREIKDVFGIRLVITGFHRPEEERKIREELNNGLKGLFIVTEPDMKKLVEKRYNEYDFIAHLNPDRFSELLKGLGINIPIEVQIYPTEDDLQRYKYGPSAHWLYKLEARFKTAQPNAPSQLFDRDFLERIYKGLKDGKFHDNFRLVYEELSRWRYIGVVRDGALRIIRATPQSIPPDIASAPGVDLFNREFIGLRRIGSEKPVSNINPDALVPGIYEVISREGGLSEEELKRIRGITTKPRTYLLIQQLLRTGLSNKDGEKLLNKCLRELGISISRKVLEENLFGIKDKDNRNIGLVYNALSLGRLDEFYRLLAEVNQNGQEAMLMELIRRTYSYMTGEDLEEDVRLEDLVHRWGIKSGEPVAVLVYLFCIAELGKRYLEEILGTTVSRPERIRRLSILLDDFEVDRLEQIYSRIGMDKEVIGKIVEMRLRSISSPYISVRYRDPKVKRIIDDVINRSGLEIVSVKMSEDGVRYDINPTRYWLERMDLVLEEMRSISGVDNVELIYTEPEKREIVFRLDFKYRDVNNLKSSLETLFKMLDITYSLHEERSNGLGYKILVPIKIFSEELEEIVRGWLNSRFGKELKVTKLVVKASRPKRKSLGNSVLLILSMLLPYIEACSGSIGQIDYVLIIIGIIVLAYLGYETYRRLERYIFKKKMEELARVWKGYEDEEVVMTELLDPFFEEDSSTLNSVYFKDVLQGLKVRWVARVMTKASDFAIPELQYDFQGYVINGRYKGNIYQFFVLKEWEDIAYQVRGGEYVSLGKDLLDECRGAIKAEVAKYIAKRGGELPFLRRLVIVPMRNRDILEKFCRDNIIVRSVISRFPAKGAPYPNFMHNKYILREDSRNVTAMYFPRVFHTRGIIGKPLFRLADRMDCLHEICHGIYDYDEILRRKILDHFQRYPNKKLEELLAIIYGYDIDNPDHREAIINEVFTYTFSEFIGISRPWREIEQLTELRERYNKMTVDEISDQLMTEIHWVSRRYDRGGQRIKDELRNKYVEVARLRNDWERGIVDDGDVRRRYYEIAKAVAELTILPPISLLDVRFFAEVGLIEPWMNPLELGFTRAQVEYPDFWVDREYYMRLIEFLIERSKAVGRWHKMKWTGEWVEAPFGEEALDCARRMAWELIKTGYGISSLGDLDKYALMDFWSSREVISTWQRIVDAENGPSIREQIKKFLDDLKEGLRRRKRLKDFIQAVDNGYKEVIKGIIYNEPWIIQAFLERIVLEEPKVLILDAQVFNELDGENSRRLAGLINQVNGRVAIVSDTNTNKDTLIKKYEDFWQRNSIWLAESGKARYRVYIIGSQTRDRFIEGVWQDILETFRVRPNNIMIFTNSRGFIQSWRRFLRDALFYILDNGKLYITSRQLYTIQEITGKEIISAKPGEKIYLLPEELYRAKSLVEEEAKSPVGQGA